MKKVCEKCGKTFQVKPHREHKAKYCSPECNYNRSNRQEIKCATCGKTFTARASRKNVKYCSNPCRHEGLRLTEEEKSKLRSRCVKICEKCGVEFSVHLYRKDTARFCSKACATPARIEKKCEMCGFSFTILPSRIDRVRFCSTVCKCNYMSFHGNTFKKCVECGKSFYAWKSVAKKQKCCSVKCAKKRLTRRVFASCLICGKKFELIPSRLKEVKYCSRKCHGLAKRKAKRPNKVQLEHLLSVQSVKDVSSFYGVAPSTIRSWSKALGVEYERCRGEYKEKEVRRRRSIEAYRRSDKQK